MAHAFADIAFTPAVRRAQEALGSRSAYARLDEGPTHHDRLGPDEAAFIAARDSFYIATVSETGWPYIQHRGGAPGFLKVLDERQIGFADYRGNRQYVTLGNLDGNDRVALFLMDYPSRARLKLLGRARAIGLGDPLLERLAPPTAPGGRAARVERGFVIAVLAFDWNCSQHISPRFTLPELQAMAGQVTGGAV